MNHIKLLFSSLFILFPLQAEIALFNKFPSLKEKIPHIELCSLPTPITQPETFNAKLGYPNLYIKRDDFSGSLSNATYLYGGNKPRKLEWLLADALHHDKKTVVTYGCAGSNHARATAVYAQKLGLKAVLLLKEQPNSEVVRENLLADLAAHAEIQAFETHEARNAKRDELLSSNEVYFIPTGGSNALGCLGFVNAAFELYEQIRDGIMPEPQVIYLPIGSCATTAGLVLGLALNNSKIKVVAVAVEPEDAPGNYGKRVKQLFKEANELLHEADTSIPLIEFPEDLLSVNTKFSGSSYGLWAQEAALAVKLFMEYEGIILEGTYSTKPVSAFIEDVVQKKLTDEVVLIWNTFCGFAQVNPEHSYKELPQLFHKYFEEEIQPLNKVVAIS
jgi:1-aminocyclopropane-1-carboxylate deaminase/D-cysteine desulfhydrase-like pyridoxal-dependent ACC family enzyme